MSNGFVDTATRFCWNRIDGLTETNPYLAMAVLTFLDHVPDRARAEAAFDRLTPLITNDVELDPHAAGEAHLPLDFAPHPDGFGRRLFTDEVIEQHLDAVVSAQSEDGSWAFNWPAWTPVVRHEWGGFVTVGPADDAAGLRPAQCLNSSAPGRHTEHLRRGTEPKPHPGEAFARQQRRREGPGVGSGDRSTSLVARRQAGYVRATMRRPRIAPTRVTRPAERCAP